MTMMVHCIQVVGLRTPVYVRVLEREDFESKKAPFSKYGRKLDILDRAREC